MRLIRRKSELARQWHTFRKRPPHSAKLESWDPC